MGVLINDEPRSRMHAVQESHALRGSGGLIQKTGGRDRESRQVFNHRLEDEQGLKSTLTDLGLVGRVCRVPRG